MKNLKETTVTGGGSTFISGNGDATAEPVRIDNKKTMKKKKRNSGPFVVDSPKIPNRKGVKIRDFRELFEECTTMGYPYSVFKYLFNKRINNKN